MDRGHVVRPKSLKEILGQSTTRIRTFVTLRVFECKMLRLQFRMIRRLLVMRFTLFAHGCDDVPLFSDGSTVNDKLFKSIKAFGKFHNSIWSND